MTWSWRPLAPGDTDHETLWAWVGLATAVMAVAWLALVEWPPVVCPMRAVSGWPCPTCGATRTALALAAGEVGLALRMNPLVASGLLLTIPYLAYAAIVSALRLPRLRVRVGAREAFAVRVAAVSLVLANWAFLIADGR
jgi:hypothetical protein